LRPFLLAAREGVIFGSFAWDIAAGMRCACFAWWE